MKSVRTLAAGTAVLLFMTAGTAAQLGVGIGVDGDGVSVGVDVGGVGVDASVGQDGVGAGAQVGDAVDAGASAGTGGIGVDAAAGPVGVDASVGQDGVSAGVDAGPVGVGVEAGVEGVSVDAAAGPAAAGVSVGTGDAVQDGTVAEPAQAAPADDVAEDDVAVRVAPPPPVIRPLSLGGSPGVPLPCTLAPCEGLGQGEPAPSGEALALGPVQGREGTSQDVLDACRITASATAVGYGMTDIAVASEGRTEMLEDGTYRAPVRMRIVYGDGNGGYESREASVWCMFDQAGTVSAFADA